MNSIKIVHVVAIDQNHCIGKDNQLIWHIPADLQHFKTLTTGGVIVMGRKTFESLGRPLSNRTHHVITRDTAWRHDGVTVAHSLEQAIHHAKQDAQRLHQDRIFIIGGGEIYRQSMAMADILEITHVDLLTDGDAFYPQIGQNFQKIKQSEKQICEKSGIGFWFASYQKQNS